MFAPSSPPACQPPSPLAGPSTENPAVRVQDGHSAGTGRSRLFCLGGAFSAHRLISGAFREHLPRCSREPHGEPPQVCAPTPAPCQLRQELAACEET